MDKYHGLPLDILVLKLILVPGGLLYGMFAFAGFFITLSLLIEKSGITVSFLSAIAVALAVQRTSLRILRQKHE